LRLNPQLPQNAASSGATAPQLGQVWVWGISRGVKQASQWVAQEGLGWAQLEQISID